MPKTTRRYIPTDRRCTDCGLQLLTQTHYAELTHGYARMRGAQEGGGVNAVKLPVWSGRFYCELCLLKRDEGVQLSLLDDDDAAT